MRFNIVIRYIGVVLLLNALFMLIAAGIALFNGMDTGFYPLLLGFFLTTALGSFPLIFVESERNISSREGYLIVVGSWIAACFTGMIPYTLWGGGEFDLADAWFESVSGFSTTGATILNQVEALPKSLLFWRSSTHWLGGIGVVMFVMLILPAMGQARQTLSNAQLSSLAKDNFRYRAHKIVQILLVVYLGLTLLQTVCLRIAGMGWFDALNHSFSTIATGGFSTKNASIAYFDSLAIECVILFFMVVSGLHFGLIFATVTGRRNNVFRSEVTRFYLFSILVAGIAIALALWKGSFYETVGESLRYGMFQLVSVMTTTGFATANSNIWPPFVILILIFFSFTCACSGSTSGGIKADRFVLSFKSLLVKIRQIQHPNAIIRVKMNEVPVSENLIQMVNAFILLYLLFVILGTLVCTVFGLDLMTAFSVSFSSMSNVGPGFGEIGSTATFEHLPVPVKLFSSVLMLLGRLEIFGLIQIFYYKAWR
ncbi:MAG: TrkH family potassium uptake protein [Rikenellaceae bacterium]|nr:TrkH family potassium uptake protein [Rikenellaceae bacterium]